MLEGTVATAGFDEVNANTTCAACGSICKINAPGGLTGLTMVKLEGVMAADKPVLDSKKVAAVPDGDRAVASQPSMA